MSKAQQLQELIANFKIRIEVKPHFSKELREIVLHIGTKFWKLLIDDEYLYLNKNNQRISFYMVLRELSIYEEEDDFLSWCHQNGSSASSNEVLNYYRDLDSTFQEIKSILGTIDPLISDYDYELGTIVRLLDN
ncbi:MAG: hypothetical protein ACJA1C_000314 [Crocinitomicaceae bacterium]